jgi:hypothetical protein
MCLGENLASIMKCLMCAFIKSSVSSFVAQIGINRTSIQAGYVFSSLVVNL